MDTAATSGFGNKTAIVIETRDMHPVQGPGFGWRVLLVGGSSGVGKTVAARAVANDLSLPLLLLDDVRLALQEATNAETHPDLHVFLNYRQEQWKDSESICADWIAIAKEMANPLQAIIRHHCIVPDVGAIMIEGDGILPSSIPPGSKEVRGVFITEHSEKQLLENLRARGRGFEEWNDSEQNGFAHASWLYGQWLAREAELLSLPVLDAQPRETIVERLLSMACSQ